MGIREVPVCSAVVSSVGLPAEALSKGDDDVASGEPLLVTVAAVFKPLALPPLYEPRTEPAPARRTAVDPAAGATPPCCCCCCASPNGEVMQIGCSSLLYCPDALRLSPLVLRINAIE
jgi:hypothetical protein